MKIEKLNLNKLKITIFKEDFTKWDMDFAKITPESQELKDVFLIVLKEIPKETDFEVKNARLVVEAAKEDDFLIMTVSKIKMPDEDGGEGKNAVFYFSGLFELICGCKRAAASYFGKSSLYKDKKGYYLILKEKSAYSKAVLSEYGELMKDKFYAEEKLAETHTLMIEDCALEKIVQISSYPLKNVSV